VSEKSLVGREAAAYNIDGWAIAGLLQLNDDGIIMLFFPVPESRYP
jgi:hypothetical protein